ncbi:hypothetical protein [Streptomyces sp. NPDC000229]|uniref:hypothetical protein n=1 Tax=Streptomyces sp. NPDC000229 TaxID=3154247 RepID=UPI00331A1D39
MKLLATHLENVKGDEVRRQRVRELLDRTAAGEGAALQRLEGESAFGPYDPLAVEDRAAGALRRG